MRFLKCSANSRRTASSCGESSEDRKRWKVAAGLGVVERVDVLPFHQMGRFKWHKLGLEYTLEDAQRSFYSGHYENASALSVSLCAAGADNDLEACELRTSSLHFQIRRAMGESADRERAWTMCATCPDLLSVFIADTNRARALARTRLQRNPDDEAAQFLLGKIDLNYVWLQLGTRGRKTGWDEYWEARTSLDKVLERNPGHLRARVRACVD